MRAVEPWPGQPSVWRGPKRPVRPYVGDRHSNSMEPSKTKGRPTITRTITVTFVPSIGPTTTTSQRTSDSGISTLITPSTELPTLPSISSSSLSTSPPIQPSPFEMITTSLPSSTVAASAAASSGAGGTIPSSSIIGIVVAVVVFLFLLAFFLAWKRRKRIRRQWINGLEDSLKVDKTSKSAFQKIRVSNGRQLPTSHAYVQGFTPERPPRLDKPVSASAALRVAGNQYPIIFQTNDPNAPRSSMVVYSPTSGIRSPTKATVVNTFITDLTDELPVTFGQELYVFAEYDDGWAFCGNEKGEKGMVPIECLAV